MTSNDQGTNLEVTLNSSSSIFVGVQFQEKNQVSFLFECPFEGTVVWFIVKELTTFDGRNLHRMICSLSVCFYIPCGCSECCSYISILYNIAHICSYHIYIYVNSQHTTCPYPKKAPLVGPQTQRGDRFRDLSRDGVDAMVTVVTDPTKWVIPKGGVLKASWDSFLLKNGI